MRAGIREGCSDLRDITDARCWREKEAPPYGDLLEVIRDGKD